MTPSARPLCCPLCVTHLPGQSVTYLAGSYPAAPLPATLADDVFGHHSRSVNLFKFKSLGGFEHVSDLLLNERLYCAEYQELNDPFEGQFMSELHLGPADFSMFLLALGQPEFPRKIRVPKTVKDYFGDTERPLRICSLSDSMHDVRMWSHYGDSHRGIAVDIDFTGFETEVHRVVYHPTLRTYSGTILGGPMPLEVLTNKTDHWSYETEYRVIQKEPYLAIPGRIRAVYCGLRVTDSKMALLAKMSAGRFPVLRTELDRDGVKVTVNLRESLRRQSE